MSKSSAASIGREKISVLQFSFLLITIVLATADVFLSALVAQQAGRDSWISVIIGTIISIPLPWSLITYLATYLWVYTLYRYMSEKKYLIKSY